MNAKTLRSMLSAGSLLSLVPVILGSIMQMPEVTGHPLLVIGIASLGSFFAGWAHMSKPGDQKAGA